MGTPDIAATIASAPWKHYTWRDHMRAEVPVPGRVEVITFAAPLTGGPVTWSVMPMRNDTEGITYDTWTPSGFMVGSFTFTGEDAPDAGGYVWRSYKADEVVPSR